MGEGSSGLEVAGDRMFEGEMGNAKQRSKNRAKDDPAVKGFIGGL
jgi:hypothetical protein